MKLFSKSEKIKQTLLATITLILTVSLCGFLMTQSDNRIMTGYGGDTPNYYISYLGVHSIELNAGWPVDFQTKKRELGCVEVHSNYIYTGLPFAFTANSGCDSNFNKIALLLDTAVYLTVILLTVILLAKNIGSEPARH